MRKEFDDWKAEDLEARIVYTFEQFTAHTEQVYDHERWCKEKPEIRKSVTFEFWL
jgi:hypothetical protein